MPRYNSRYIAQKCKGAYVSVDESTTKLNRSRELRALQLSMGAYALVFVLKVMAYFATGVLALLADGIHSLTDIIIVVFLIVALEYSRKTADDAHMYGHARAQNVAALIAATLFISFTSFQLYEDAAQKLLHGGGVFQDLQLALAVVIISMIVEALPLLNVLKQQGKGPVLTAQLADLFNDELALCAVLIGTIFIIFGLPVADPVAVIIVATIIAVRGALLLRDNASFLLGRSPGVTFLARVESTALSVQGVMGIHELRGEFIGPGMVHLEMHITVAPGTPIEEAHEISALVRERINQEEGCDYCIIHVGPSRIAHDGQ
jgi:cation diffusion facilitator family transporter